MASQSVTAAHILMDLLNGTLPSAGLDLLDALALYGVSGLPSPSPPPLGPRIVSTFESLPAEIMSKIYKCLFQLDEPINLGPGGEQYNLSAQILRVCKSIYVSGKFALVSMNTFALVRSLQVNQFHRYYRPMRFDLDHIHHVACPNPSIIKPYRVNGLRALQSLKTVSYTMPCATLPMTGREIQEKIEGHTLMIDFAIPLLCMHPAGPELTAVLPGNLVSSHHRATIHASVKQVQDRPAFEANIIRIAIQGRDYTTQQFEAFQTALAAGQVLVMSAGRLTVPV